MAKSGARINSAAAEATKRVVTNVTTPPRTAKQSDGKFAEQKKATSFKSFRFER